MCSDFILSFFFTFSFFNLFTPPPPPPGVTHQHQVRLHSK